MNVMGSLKQLTVAFAITGICLAGSALAAPKPNTAKESVAKIDTKGSSVKWLGKKVTGKHNGSVAIQSGEIKMNGKDLVGGTIVIDMTSITVEDIPAKDSSNAKLVGHLKSDDFFGSDEFKTATFTIKNVKALATKGEATHEITGDLEIKGVKQEITVPMKVVQNGGEATATGTLIVDRTKFNIRYGSASFFDKLGDKAIDNNFELDLAIKAKI